MIDWLIEIYRATGGKYHLPLFTLVDLFRWHNTRRQKFMLATCQSKHAERAPARWMGAADFVTLRHTVMVDLKECRPRRHVANVLTLWATNLSASVKKAVIIELAQQDGHIGQWRVTPFYSGNDRINFRPTDMVQTSWHTGILNLNNILSTVKLTKKRWPPSIGAMNFRHADRSIIDTERNLSSLDPLSFPSFIHLSRSILSIYPSFLIFTIYFHLSPFIFLISFSVLPLPRPP